MLKTTFQQFWIFLNLRKSSEVLGNLRKSSEKSENVGKFSKWSSDNFWRLSKIFGNLRKCSEMLGKPRKPSENFRMYLEVYKKFLTFQYLTSMDWRSDSRISSSSIVIIISPCPDCPRVLQLTVRRYGGWARGTHKEILAAALLHVWEGWVRVRPRGPPVGYHLGDVLQRLNHWSLSAGDGSLRYD